MSLDPILVDRVEEELYDLSELVREIQAYTGEPEGDVWRRLCTEITRPGSTTSSLVDAFGITPHVYDDCMLRLYQESDGFIYETTAESINRFRRGKWRGMVEFLVGRMPGGSQHIPVLLYGDSVGSDTIYLGRLGYDVTYHDYDSYCSRFAWSRFEARGLPVRRFSPGASQRFPVIICLEVAEHVPDPVELIKELAGLLAPGGLLFFSEAFGLLNEAYPTHLASNSCYAGKTVSLFREQGLSVLWREPHDKPFVFTNSWRLDVRYWNPVHRVLSKLARCRSC